MNAFLRLAIAILCVAVLLPCNAHGQSDEVDWSGLWAAEKTYGPSFAGPVSLQKAGALWLARVQGETAIATREEQVDGAIKWRFEFVGQGYFAGRQASATAAIIGHWYQPSGVIASYPIATPVRLSSENTDFFEGTLAPYIDRVALYIPLVRETDEPDKNRYSTYLKNPQRNFGVFFRIDSATVVGEEIRFAQQDGDVIATAYSLEPGERFSLVFGRTGETLEFSKRRRDAAPGFYPRRQPMALSTLVQPGQLDDGWETTTPAESGLKEAPILALVNSLAAFEPTGLRQPYIHSLHIAHRGKLVVDEYYHGFGSNDTHDSRSAGKSLTSALLGIALKQQLIATIDQPVYSFFGGVGAFANPDPRKSKITLRHLVTMSSGLDCDDGNYDSPGNEDVMQNQNAQPDWYRYALDLDMVRAPGEAGVYCTAGINLIGGALSHAAGTTLAQFFEAEFAAPLGISHYEMNLSPTEHAYMGGGIRLRPRDFLKLGQLYLDGGRWNGTQLLAEDFVKASAAAHASINVTDDYGFAWWRQTYMVDGRNIDTFYASGNGGQLLFVVPSLDMVVLIQAGNYSDGRTRNAFRDQFMREHFLPAAL